MIINNHKLNVTMVAFDGCHKIYIPAPNTERSFKKGMKNKGWDLKEDFYRVDGVKNLMEMYMDSCPLRFIQQVDFSNGKEEYSDIIPQCEFTDDEGFFDEDLARKAFVA